MSSQVKKVIIPAAGFGTRLLPVTKALPKEMLPILDTPIIQIAIEEAIASGIEEIIIIIGEGKQAIEYHFEQNLSLENFLKEKGKHDLLKKIQKTSPGIKIAYILQPEMKGLGHAISLAKDFTNNEPVAVILPDDIIFSSTPCLKQMIDIWNTKESAILATMEVPKKEVSHYGILDPKKVEGNLISVKDMVEKPEIDAAPSQYAIIGRYILPPEIFDILEKTPASKSGEIQLTDALRTLNKSHNIYGYLFDGKRFDAGSTTGLLKANTFAALQRDDIKEEYTKFLLELLK